MLDYTAKLQLNLQKLMATRELYNFVACIFLFMYYIIMDYIFKAAHFLKSIMSSRNMGLALEIQHVHSFKYVEKLNADSLPCLIWELSCNIRNVAYMASCVEKHLLLFYPCVLIVHVCIYDMEQQSAFHLLCQNGWFSQIWSQIKI